LNWREIKRIYCSWRFGSTGWRDVQGAYWSFRCGRFGNEAVAAEQAFHRMVWWLYALLGEERGREFMLGVVDPDKPQ
jgi:hypothetical protein